MWQRRWGGPGAGAPTGQRPCGRCRRGSGPACPAPGVQARSRGMARSGWPQRTGHRRRSPGRPGFRPSGEDPGEEAETARGWPWPCTTTRRPGHCVSSVALAPRGRPWWPRCRAPSPRTPGRRSGGLGPGGARLGHSGSGLGLGPRIRRQTRFRNAAVISAHPGQGLRLLLGPGPGPGRWVAGGSGATPAELSPPSRRRPGPGLSPLRPLRPPALRSRRRGRAWLCLPPRAGPCPARPGPARGERVTELRHRRAGAGGRAGPGRGDGEGSGRALPSSGPS